MLMHKLASEMQGLWYWSQADPIAQIRDEIPASESNRPPMFGIYPAGAVERVLDLDSGHWRSSE